MRTLLCLLLCGVALLPVSVLAKVPSDENYSLLWYLPHIQAEEAWEVSTGSPEVIVAVIDTGISPVHEDLVENLWTNSGEIPDNEQDDDGNGYVDDVHGWDFVDNDATPFPDDAEETVATHGTFVAGMIGAVGDNAEDLTGVAWNVRLLPLRILDNDGVGSEDDVVRALAYAKSVGVDVVNLSFAGNEGHGAMRDAVRDAYRAGIVIVAALGNDARDVDDAPVYPACLRSEEEDWVIGVTATTAQDTATDFTSYGHSCADIAAPGEDIYGLAFTSETSGKIEGPWSGTSMASPIVSGVAALVRARYPELSPDGVRAALKLGVDPLYATGSLRGELGVGRVNALRTLQIAEDIARTEGVSVRTVEEVATESILRDQESSYVAASREDASGTLLDIFRVDGSVYATFAPFASSGEITAELDDLDNDGELDVVVSHAIGGDGTVRVFTAQGVFRGEFSAFPESLNDGVAIALGDLDGDEVEDIAGVVGASANSDVRWFSQQGELLGSFPVKGFAPDVHLGVAIADIDWDFDKELVVFAQEGEPRIQVYDQDGTLKGDFLAYDAAMHGGLLVRAADFDGDLRDELVVVGAHGGPGDVRIFTTSGALWGIFSAVDSGEVSSGLSLAVSDIDVDGIWDIVTRPRRNEAPVAIWSPRGQFMGSVPLPNQASSWVTAW